MEDYKKLVIKLGGQCNFNCPHCHSKKQDFKWNNDVLDYIDKSNFTDITFSGGEPLLYFKYIKKIIKRFGNRFKYKIVSNGSLINDSIVKFINTYNIHIGFSYDGEDGDRNKDFVPWRLISKIKSKGLATLYTPSNNDFNKLSNDIKKLIEFYNLDINKSGVFWFNFPHQTRVNLNNNITKEFAKQYCLLMGRFLELDFLADRITEQSVLGIFFNIYIRKRNIRGVRCFSEQKISLAINGDFLLCPYDDICVGNIYTGIDWDKVESYIPKRCKQCEQWQSCMNTCIANVTENECYISKVLYKHFHKLIDKYGYSYEYLATHIKE